MSAVSSNGYERRYALGEVRADDVERRRIKGRAIVFNSPSVDLGGFTEIIKPEAVDRTIREAADVRALVDHDSSKIIGRTRSGTLALRKSRQGLEVEIELPDTSYARDVMESVSRGDISGMSFGFRVITDEWRMEDGQPLREVLDMEVSEVSIVSFPAYPQTDVAVRSLQEFQHGFHGSRLDMLARELRMARAR